MEGINKPPDMTLIRGLISSNTPGITRCTLSVTLETQTKAAGLSLISIEKRI